MFTRKAQTIRISGVLLYKCCGTLLLGQMTVPIVFAQAVMFLTYVW